MKKVLFKSVTALIALCLALFGFAACSDGEVSDGKFPSVDASTITVRESDAGIIVSWKAVTADGGTPAGGYAVTCNSQKTTVSSYYVNLSNWSGFKFPDDGVFKFTIVAQAYNYTDSDPVNYTYTAKGVKLNSPQIKSFESGVLRWDGVTSASAYKVSVDGAPVSDGGDGLYRGTSLDLSNYPAGNALKISISAVGNNDRYFSESDATVVGVNSAHTKLTLLPVEDYQLNGSVITWSPVGGASAYRVVNLDMTVAKIVKANDTLRYDMTSNKLIIGVFPISADSTIADAEIAPVDIKYLDGEGTQQSPYLIKTPFDLRAVDYYEFMYADKYAAELAEGTAPAGNRYRVENNINFNSVAALDSESNFFTLTQPFYGYLDGNLKKLSNIRVVYDGGYWAMFDFITTNATVRDLIFSGAEIENMLQDPDFPLGASIAAVAHKNYGTIRGVTLTDARFAATGGSVSGICTNNYGTVTKCTVSGEFIQNPIKTMLGDDAVLLFNQTTYEMAGVVLENYGTVSENVVTRLDIRGGECDLVTEWKTDDYGNRIKPLAYGKPYNNVRSAAGIVSINRTGGVVSGNSFETVNLIKVNADYESGTEFGGLVAYNARGATVTYTKAHLGTFTYSNTASVGQRVSAEKGKSGDYRGTVVGKNDGKATEN